MTKSAIMKNLNQVIEAVKDEQPVNEDELRLAVVCLSALANMFFMKIVNASNSKYPKVILDAEAQRNFYRAALTESMRTWLGADNTPGSEEYRMSRIVVKNLLNKFTNDEHS